MPPPFFAGMSLWFQSRRVFVLLVALWGFTLAGIQSFPLETHEAFVLATAQEMKTGGDWILPRFNDELRLNKPPLNYWATLLVAAADPVRADIQIYHGRLVSLLAVLMMVLLTVRTGRKLYGRETGILAAVFIMGTGGMLSLSNNAKPDTLYAALCTLQLAAWIDAWQAATPSRQRWSAWLGWAAAGLATLTKGPQVPAVFLLGMAAFLAAGPDRRRALAVLRPLSGAALFCTLVLPWWLLLQQRLRALGVDFSDSQLSGSLLHNLASWRELLSVYYLWMPLAQMLPFSLLLVPLLPRLVKSRPPMSPATRLLAYVSITLLVLFTLGGHYRKHYLLPLLPVFALLLADSVRLIRFPGFNAAWVKLLVVAGAAGALGCAGLMLWQGEYAALALFAGLSLLTARLLSRELADTFGGQPLFARQLLVMAAAVIPLGTGFYTYAPAQRWPATEQELKKFAGEQLSGNDRLVCWKTSVNILPYFARRPVQAFTDEAKLRRYVADNQNRHPVFAVLPAHELPAFGERFEIRHVRTSDNRRNPKNSLSLVEILGSREGLPAQKTD